MRFIHVVLMGLMAVTLGGCPGAGVTDSLKPVCDVLIGPIKYNSTKKDSRRYAGPALAPDLKRRNQVGQNVGCPQYRNP